MDVDVLTAMDPNLNSISEFVPGNRTGEMVWNPYIYIIGELFFVFVQVFDS